MKGAQGELYLLFAGMFFVFMGCFLFVMPGLDIYDYFTKGGEDTVILYSFTNLIFPSFYIFVGIFGVRRRDEIYYSDRQTLLAGLVILAALIERIFLGNAIFTGGIIKRILFDIDDFVSYILIALSLIYLYGAQRNK